MKNHNALAFILLAVSIVSCNDTKKYFSIDESKLEAQYKPENSVLLSLINTENKTIDSVVYAINDKRIGSKNDLTPFKFELKNQKFGYQNITASVFYDGKKEVDSSRVEVISNIKPKALSYTLVNTYPHDVNSFTEGLEFYKDTLYESIGQYGKSKLLKTDFKTGKIIKELRLDDKYFAEGITFLNDKIYQLTYHEKVGFIYDAKTWKLEKTFTFDKPEGWGMTNDGKNIYFNDSSEKIWKMNPETQQTFDYINTYSEGTKVKEVNELEWVDGKIYSNVWQRDAIVVINPANGAVEGILDLSELKKKVLKLENTDVLNGIAYNPKTKTLFVTGKNWDKMFEIKVSGF